MKNFLLIILAIFLGYIAAYISKGNKLGYNFIPINEKVKTTKTIKDAVAEYENKNFNKAIEILNELYEHQPQNTEILYYKGLCYLELDQKYTAAEYFEKIKTIDPNHGNAYFKTGYIHYLNKEYDFAINDLYAAVEKQNADNYAYYYLAQCYQNQSNFEAAIQTIQTALTKDSLNTEFIFLEAYLYHEKEELRTAINLYSKVLKIKPDDKYSLLNRGLCFDNINRYDSAETDYLKVISLYPDYELAYNNIGWLYYEQKKYEKARQNYNKALELVPDYQLALWNRANLFWTIKLYEYAIIDYEKLYKADNVNNINALFNIAKIYNETGETEMCKEKIIEFLKYADNNNKNYNEALTLLKQ